jgi:hypothetical protein
LASIALFKIGVKQTHDRLACADNEPRHQGQNKKRRSGKGTKPPHPQCAQLSDEIPHPQTFSAPKT